MNPPPANTPRKRSKVSRACDEIRCDANPEEGRFQCSSCKRSGEKCCFCRVPLKRGPSKGQKRDSVGSNPPVKAKNDTPSSTTDLKESPPVESTGGSFRKRSFSITCAALAHNTVPADDLKLLPPPHSLLSSSSSTQQNINSSSSSPNTPGYNNNQSYNTSINNHNQTRISALLNASSSSSSSSNTTTTNTTPSSSTSSTSPTELPSIKNFFRQNSRSNSGSEKFPSILLPKISSYQKSYYNSSTEPLQQQPKSPNSSSIEAAAFSIAKLRNEKNSTTENNNNNNNKPFDYLKNGYNSRSNSVPNIYQDSASYHHHYQQQQQQATYHPPILIPNENSDGGFHYYKEPVSEFSNWNEATIDTYYQIIHPTLPILPTSKIQLKNWLASFESKDLAGALLDALTGLTLKLSQNVIPSQQAFQLKSALLKSSPGNSNNNKSTSGASPSPEDEVLLKTVASHQNNLLQFIWTISSKYGGMMAENLRFNDKCCFMVLLIFLFLYTDDSMWLASAISLGYSLELHHTYTNKNISEIDCRRLFLVLVILDCVNSFSNCNSSRQGLINFPTFIPESVIHFDQVRDATVFNLSSSSSNKNNQERNSSSSTSGGVYIIKLCMVYKHANSARNKLSSFNFASSTTTFSEVADGNNTGNKTTKEDSLKSCLQLLKSLLKELDLVKMEIEGIWDTTPILKALYYSVLVSVLSTEFSLYQAPRNEEEEESLSSSTSPSPSPASSSVTEFYNRSLKFINTLNELITLMASPLISASPLVAYLYKLVAVNMIKLSSVMVTVPARENNSTGHKYWFAFEMSNWNENLQSMSKLSLYSMDSNKDEVKNFSATNTTTNEESTNKQHEQYLLLSLASNISQTLKYLHHIGVVSICLVIHNEPLKQVIEANEEINRKIELVSSFLQYSSNVTTSISSNNNSNNKTPSPRSSAAQLEDENIPSPSTKRKRRSEESTSTGGNSGNNGSTTTNNNNAQQNEQRRNKKSKSPHSISHESSEEEIPFPLIVQSTSSSTNGTNITKVEDNKSIHHYNNNNAGSLAVAAASSILSFSKSIHHHHSSGDDEDYDDENKNNHKTRAPSALESLASIAGNVISS